MFRIFNHSSKSMSEIPDGKIDLVITDPPYNIGTRYVDHPDLCDREKYQKLLESVFRETYRVIKPEGRLVLATADTIFQKGDYMQLAAVMRSLCERHRFHLINRHVSFVHSKNFRELVDRDHKWKSNFSTSEDSHSNTQQILVFTKIPAKHEFDKSRMLYYNYVERESHPCPYDVRFIEDMLGMYFKRGMNVLDPFMGTASLGEEVIKRGGNFYGYEIREFYFKKAETRLKRVSKT